MEERIFITTSDIMRITGKKKSFASKNLQTCKDALDKMLITFKEYAEYYDIDVNIIFQRLNIKPF